MSKDATEPMSMAADVAAVATSSDSRRILAAVSSNAQFSTLTPGERARAHAIIDARIAERAAQQRFGPASRRSNRTTVSIDDDGTLIEIAPDGSRQAL